MPFRFDSFNAYKTLVHVPYWMPIKDGIIPPPLSVAIDPCGTCNLSCSFCNASKVLNNDMLSKEQMDEVLDACKYFKVRSACVSGGGEPFFNPNTGYLVENLLKNDTKVGMTTNGTLIDKHHDVLSNCTFVGISIDAGIAETYATIKGTTIKEFSSLLSKIEEFAKKKRIGLLTYKFLIHPLNMKEVYEAAEMAKLVGCDEIYFRPGGSPYFSLEENEFSFNQNEISWVKALIEAARSDFEDETFKVNCMFDKVNEKWTPNHSFSKCYGPLTLGLFASNGKFYLCIDRRGDESLYLCETSELKDVWGSQKHKDLVNAIDITKCPRCTLMAVNQIIENVVINDKMNVDFI